MWNLYNFLSGTFFVKIKRSLVIWIFYYIFYFGENAPFWILDHHWIASSRFLPDDSWGIDSLRRTNERKFDLDEWSGEWDQMGLNRTNFSELETWGENYITQSNSESSNFTLNRGWNCVSKNRTRAFDVNKIWGASIVVSNSRAIKTRVCIEIYWFWSQYSQWADVCTRNVFMYSCIFMTE